MDPSAPSTGLASLLYVAFSAVLTVVIYRLVVQGWMEGIMPDVLAAGLAWVLAAVSVLGELRGAT